YYMAPEQWRDPDAVDARTDIYALGVLLYEALTGARPIRGRDLRDLQRAHAEDPVPPLGTPVDAVLARALAKRQADRFSSALELAAAFRDACGLGSASVEAPPLDDAVR